MEAKYSYRAKNWGWEITCNGVAVNGEERFTSRNAAYARCCELNGWKYDLPTEKQMKYLAFLASDAKYKRLAVVFCVKSGKASRKQVSALIDSMKSGRSIDSLIYDLQN